MIDVLCIGGGPAGLTAAYELAKAGSKVVVLEKDPLYLGGISRTVQKDGFYFDIGGHRFFSKSAEIMALWKEILGKDLLTRPRKSRIYYGRKFYPYPLNLYRTLVNLGVMESGLCALSYLHARVRPYPKPDTFEQWVINQFGVRLFNTFFKTYTEKVWGMPCSTISADWAAQRIKGLSLFSAVKNAAVSALGLKPSGRVIKTLIEEFLYPRKGPGMMWEAAAQKIIAMGGVVKLGCDVKSLRYDPNAREWNISYVDYASGDKTTATAKHVVSSMPLKELISALPMVPDTIQQAAAMLRYRDFITVALFVLDRDVFNDNWIYVHDPAVRVGRIQNFKSWSPEMVRDSTYTCYGMEYFCFENDGLWNSTDEELIALATTELMAIHLAEREDIKGGYVIRQRKAYPVYDNDYQQHVDRIRHWLEEDCPNLQVVGRNGMHKYNNQDHSMMTALLAARNILAGRRAYNLWQVNQDAEYHEESGAGVSGERLVPRMKK